MVQLKVGQRMISDNTFAWILYLIHLSFLLPGGSDYNAVLKSDFIKSNMSFLNVSFLLVDDDIVEDEKEDFFIVMFVTANYHILTEVNTTKIIILDDDCKMLFWTI